MLNVVVINGGRGAAALIPAFLDREGINLTSIVNAYDDGKSTGEIRRMFNMLGPSDIRKVQKLMLPRRDAAFAAYERLYDYRFPVDAKRSTLLADLRNFAGGGDHVAAIEIASHPVRRQLQRFAGEFLDAVQLLEDVYGEQFQFGDCSILNCLFAGAHLAHHRDFEAATLAMERLFQLRGTVLPNSTECRTLTALRRNGEVLYCEADIVELRSNVLIEQIYLVEQPIRRGTLDDLALDRKRHFLSRQHATARLSDGSKRAIAQADVVIYAPGTQHSSLYPTYLSLGFGDAVVSNRSALKVFVCNIGADYETPSYTASDFLEGAHRYICRGDGRAHPLDQLVDIVLVNTSRIKPEETYVEADTAAFARFPVDVITGVFEDQASPGRHNGALLASMILERYDSRL